jgi:hypothetical protein
MSLWGAVVGAVEGFVAGGPAGAIAGGVMGLASGGGGSPGTAVAVRPAAPVTPFGGFGIGGGATIGPGGAQVGYGLTWGGQPTATATIAAGQCPKGYHLNKHPLKASRTHGAVAARSICVRNRHMNPLNYRALRRALTREKRAGKIVRRLHIFHTRRPAAAAPRRKR